MWRWDQALKESSTDSTDSGCLVMMGEHPFFNNPKVEILGKVAKLQSGKVQVFKETTHRDRYDSLRLNLKFSSTMMTHDHLMDLSSDISRRNYGININHNTASAGALAATADCKIRAYTGAHGTGDFEDILDGGSSGAVLKNLDFSNLRGGGRLLPGDRINSLRCRCGSDPPTTPMPTPAPTPLFGSVGAGFNGWTEPNLHYYCPGGLGSETMGMRGTITSPAEGGQLGHFANIYPAAARPLTAEHVLRATGHMPVNIFNVRSFDAYISGPWVHVWPVVNVQTDTASTLVHVDVSWTIGGSCTCGYCGE